MGFPGSSHEAEDGPKVVVAALEWRKKRQYQSQLADRNGMLAKCPESLALGNSQHSSSATSHTRFGVLTVPHTSSVNSGAGAVSSLI